MPSIDQAAEPIATAISSIGDVTSHIETTCARVGDHLGRGHIAFQDLSTALTVLSQELSGAQTGGGATALRSISSRLDGFAQAAPVESQLLGNIGEILADASSILDALLSQIKIVSIIARSARIEAASLDKHQASFLDFTKEVFDLASSIQTAVESCARDQSLLAKAIDVALKKQREFQTRYGLELKTVSADLISVYAEIERQQTQSAQLADFTRSGTAKIADAVGRSIVSLQAGDSVRQRLEHISEALHLAASSSVAGVAPSLQEQVGETAQAAPAIFMLQVAHLKAVIPSFDAEIGLIQRSLAPLSLDTMGMVARGQSLFADCGSDTTSPLTLMRQKLTRASALTTACENARRSVDSALSVVADALGEFRSAVAGLADAVLDIILIGMNAGLKAGHLGEQGRAFVVIANELKATADKMVASTGLLNPKLNQIAQFVDELKQSRAAGHLAKGDDHERAIADSMDQVASGNQQIEKLMGSLIDIGANFEQSLAEAQALLTALADKNKALPTAINLIKATEGFNVIPSPSDRVSTESALDKLYAAYTMEEERNIHRTFLKNHGMVQSVNDIAKTDAVMDDDALFF